MELLVISYCTLPEKFYRKSSIKHPPPFRGGKLISLPPLLSPPPPPLHHPYSSQTINVD